MKNNNQNQKEGEVSTHRMVLNKNDLNQIRLIEERAFKIKLENIFDNDIDFLLKNIRYF